MKLIVLSLTFLSLSSFAGEVKCSVSVNGIKDRQITVGNGTFIEGQALKAREDIFVEITSIGETNNSIRVTIAKNENGLNQLLANTTGSANSDLTVTADDENVKVECNKL